jgi:hypothetical protein
MSSIKLTADSGGGTFEIKAPSSSGNTRVLTLPDTQNLTLNGGKILQVVQTVKTDVFTTTSQSFTDITGLSGTITPTSSSNKILISYTLSVSGNGYPMFKLLRGSTDIFVGDAASNRVRCLFGGYVGGSQINSMMIPVSGNFLDSPSTTSATTYKFQTGVIHTTGYTTYLNRSPSDTDFNYHGRTASDIILMEVAA